MKWLVKLFSASTERFTKHLYFVIIVHIRHPYTCAITFFQCFLSSKEVYTCGSDWHGIRISYDPNRDYRALQFRVEPFDRHEQMKLVLYIPIDF
jgi:hypothetical protein